MARETNNRLVAGTGRARDTRADLHERSLERVTRIELALSAWESTDPAVRIADQPRPYTASTRD